ncbi:MAG: RluA family pseudouridine synthase [Acutalibacteraceae bacterium]|nr:RluA family pseudouridine synthase [Acutalibacteraceae bacterium]
MREVILKFTVPAQYDNTQAKWFLRNYCNISVRLITALKLVPLGISRNGELLRVIDTVFENDIIQIKLPEDNNEIEPVDILLDICYEDDHIMVLNKPPYMPVHPTHGHIDDTLANGVAFYLNNKNESFSFRAINRIDRDTTGLVLVAKHSYAASNLVKNVQKKYVAVCEGEILNSGTIDAKISLLPGHTIQRTAGTSDGVTAITHYNPILIKNGHTLVEFNLETGRTHQIRVHMSHISHPLAGDDMYGGSLEYIKRQALHCKTITFLHPVTHKEITVTTDLPEDMQNIIR